MEGKNVKKTEKRKNKKVRINTKKEERLRKIKKD